VNIEELMDENARLKAELRKRALESLSDIGQLGEQSAEIAHLKAEVERLRASSFVTAVPVEEYEKLKAEVERLTDAITRGAIIPDAKPVNANPRKDAEINPFQSPHE